MTSAVVLAALLVHTAASASYVPLSRGKVVNFTTTGRLTDKGIVKFVKDPALVGALPSPLCPALSGVRLITDLDDFTFPLDCNAWRPWGDGYAYLDPYGVNGVQKILFTPGSVGGQLKVRFGGRTYASDPPNGPVAFVEISLVVGQTPYCGRFASPPSSIAVNEHNQVLIRGASTTCLSPPPTLGAPAGTAAATVTVTATRTETSSPLPTDTRTPVPTRTPKQLASPTEPMTETPTPGPNTLTSGCARVGDKNPKVADKAAAQTLRWLRDWANCLWHHGYTGPECEVHLGRGPNFDAVLKTTGGELINELVCNDPRCTRDIGRSLNHCQKKFVYEGFCSLDDWDKVWRWSGDPPLLDTGKCSATTGKDCVTDADCGGGETCLAPSSCDVYKFAPTGWEPCRCIQEAFVKPQLDEWLADVRALSQPVTNHCAKAAFNSMGEAIGPMIESGCLDPNDPTCVAAINDCEAQWGSNALQYWCGSCPLGPDGSCPADCPEAQIPCQTWMTWCTAAKARFDPLRVGTRMSSPLIA